MAKYKNSNVQFYNSLSAQQMIDLMSISKIGVLPASGLLWESLSVGLPSIFGYYVDNQIDICLHNPTIVNSLCIGDYRAIELQDLADQINVLYHNQKENSALKRRNIKENYIHLMQSELTCRRAVAGDCDLYFAWANDPITRCMAFNKEPIPYENHCKWFSCKIESKSAALYIFYSKEIPVGQVRFEINGNEAEIDISIDKCHRGNGLGTKMLNLAIFWFSIENPGITPVSEVLSENVASQRMFEKCSFTKISENYEFKKYEFHYSF
jgi:RimJ/RimL family protein N-acetyltransferase